MKSENENKGNQKNFHEFHGNIIKEMNTSMQKGKLSKKKLTAKIRVFTYRRKMNGMQWKQIFTF